MTGPASRKDKILEIALVNNMPDQALAATQTQFARLVRAGAEGRAIRWRCYSLPGIERSETARRYLARNHEDIETLYRRGADALIVTGCEPRAARLDQEPYWPQLQTLVDWAATHTASTIWSCLAAHAAVLHLSGVQRERMPKKVSGVYAFEPVRKHWAGQTEKGAALVPHSRHNGLRPDALEAKGFTIASISTEVGVDTFWREEPSLFVFLQGHPEYDAETLLKEYRRDVLRYLGGERSDYPEQPANYFSPAVSEELDALRIAVMSGDEVCAADRLSAVLSQQACDMPWRDHSIALYRDWLRVISERTGVWREIA